MKLGADFKFELHIEGTDTVTNEVLFFHQSKDFDVERKSQSIMIQTDKPLYQPGQTGLIILKPEFLCDRLGMKY